LQSQLFLFFLQASLAGIPMESSLEIMENIQADKMRHWFMLPRFLRYSTRIKQPCNAEHKPAAIQGPLISFSENSRQDAFERSRCSGSWVHEQAALLLHTMVGFSLA